MTERIRVGPASLADVRELRHRVLRPGQPPGVLDGPDDTVSVHYAAWDGDRVVGTVRILPAAYDSEPDAWQLRSMAVDPRWQGRGIGRLLVDAIVAEARSRGVPLLWANARTSALGFYRKGGWHVVGDEFVQQASGLPHYRIVLSLSDAETPDTETPDAQTREVSVISPDRAQEPRSGR